MTSRRATLANLLLVACIAVPLAASAHDRWANGDPVPDWVKRDCCSEAHAHHLSESMLHDRPDGIHVDGYEHVIPYFAVRPSPDGSIWLFYSTDTAGYQTEPYCFFRPSTGF